jgi:predicted RNase H-like nuclease (RuvC/YqgF family)
MAIIQQYHKDTNTTYVYDSQSYWDAEKGQSRSKRKCIGKIDPVTGQMVPTGKQGKKKKEGTAKISEDEINPYKALNDQLQKENLCLKTEISEHKKKISDLVKQNEQLQTLFNKIGKLISDR